MTRTKAALGVFGIRPEAVRAWLTLGAVLDHMDTQGQTPVCTANPDDWSADARPDVRAEAAQACAWCPAQAACHAFATANAERYGVYGGRDFTHTTKTKKEPAA